MSNITTLTPFALTAKGHELLLKAQAGKCKLEIVGVKIGDGFLVEGQTIESLTALVHEIPTSDGTSATEAPIAALGEVYTDTDSQGRKRCMIHTYIRNGNQTSTRITECGILVKDTDGSTVLYGATNLGNSSMPFEQYNGSTPIVYNWTFPLYISEDANINMNMGFVAGVARETYNAHIANTEDPHTIEFTEAETLANITSGEKLSLIFGKIKKAISSLISLGQNTIPLSQKGSAGGVAELDSNGMVPSTQLPSYVDDVLNGTAQGVTETSAGTYSATGFILQGQSSLCTPEDGKTYIDTATNIQYRWTGTAFVSMGSNLALGETSRTAYRGDCGAAAYSHSLQPHAPSNANYYVHPSSHSATMISETNDRQFVSATEKSDWNSIAKNLILAMFPDCILPSSDYTISNLTLKITSYNNIFDYVEGINSGARKRFVICIQNCPDTFDTITDIDGFTCTNDFAIQQGENAIIAITVNDAQFTTGTAKLVAKW